MAFGEEYYQNAVQLLRDIRGDAEILAEVATKATDALRTSRTVYANITTGHMPTYELINDREGNPAFFEFTGADSCTPEQFAAMREGDVLLTNSVNESVRAARDVGIYVEKPALRLFFRISCVFPYILMLGEAILIPYLGGYCYPA